MQRDPIVAATPEPMPAHWHLGSYPGQIQSISSRSRAGSAGSAKSIPLQPIIEDIELSIDAVPNVYGFVTISYRGTNNERLGLQQNGSSCFESCYVEHPTIADDASSEVEVSMDSFIYDDASQHKLITMNICGCEPETLPIFITIDMLLAVYYHGFDREYYFNDHEVGRFMGHIVYFEYLGSEQFIYIDIGAKDNFIILREKKEDTLVCL